MVEPVLPPGGILRLDAACRDTEEERFLLVRVRSAGALGPPVTPYTILDWGHAKTLDVPSYTNRGALVGGAIRSSAPITGIDRSGRHVSRSEEPFAIAGSPLIGADWHANPDLGFALGAGPFEESQVWAQLTPTIHTSGPWQAHREGSPDLDEVRRMLREFGHPLWDPDSLLDRAESAVADWDVVVGPALHDPTHVCLADAPLRRQADDDGGTFEMDLGTWWSLLGGADPAVAALQGSYARLPLMEPAHETVGRLVAVLGAFFVPVAPSAAAHALAVQWGSDTPSSYGPAGDLMHRMWPDLQSTADALADTQQLVFLWAPAIVAPLPDVPRRPTLTTLRDDALTDDTWLSRLVVRGHEGAPLAIRAECDGQVEEDVVLTPLSGELSYRWRVADAAYDVRAQDPFGQWGDPGFADAEPPPPRAPGPAAVTLEFEPVDPEPGHDGPASPGWVQIAAHTGSPGSGTARIVRLTAFLEQCATGSVLLEPDDDGAWWRATVPVRATRPGERAVVTATLRADFNGGTATSPRKTVVATDGRVVVVRASSPALLHAGARRPDGSCEVDLALGSPPSGVTFRVYAADEAALTGEPSPRRPRYDRVAGLAAAARDRTRFVALPDSTSKRERRPDGTEALRVRLPLPGRSSALRVLQLVAVSPAGVETPAPACGVVVVGAPLDDAPGVPAVAAASTEARVIEATVVVTHPRSGAAVPLPLARRGLDTSAPLPVQVLWGSVRGPAGTLVATEVDAAADHPDAAVGVWRWTAHARLTVPPGVPAYPVLAISARAAWPTEPAWRPGTALQPGTVRGWWRDPAPQPGEWSPASVPVTVRGAESPPVITCSMYDQFGTRLFQVVLPRNDSASSFWRLTVAYPDGTQWSGPASGGGVHTNVPVRPLGAGEDPRVWLSITCPDGSAGPVFDRHGQPV